eukprot:g3729.t1
MQISIKTLTGRKSNFNFEPDNYVKHVKEALQEKEGIQIEQIRLIYLGKQMSDDNQLQDYNVKPGSIIHMPSSTADGSKTAPSIPGIAYEEWLASHKLFRTAKALHSRHRTVVCKIFFHRELLDPKVFSEIVRVLRKLRRMLHNSSNVVAYQEIEFIDNELLGGAPVRESAAGAAGGAVVQGHQGQAVGAASPGGGLTGGDFSPGAEGFSNVGTPVAAVGGVAATSTIGSAAAAEQTTSNQLTLQQQAVTSSVADPQLSLVLLLRPYWKRSLQDRLHCRPFLSLAEKNVLAFQLLHGLCELHRQEIPHLDIKTENVFVVNGCERLILSDLGYPFKPVYLSENNPADFSFYFSSASYYYERRVFLAPERLVGDLEFALLTTGSKLPASLASRGTSATSSSTSASAAQLQQKNKLKNENLRGGGANANANAAGEVDAGNLFSSVLAPMDVFSAGCVLADIFLDGTPLIQDLPELLQYRNESQNFFKKSLEPRLAKIPSATFRTLIAEMVHVDPRKRPTGLECLKRVYAENPSGYAVLHSFAQFCTHPLLQNADLWTCFLRKNLGKIILSSKDSNKMNSSHNIDQITMQNACLSAARSCNYFGEQLVKVGAAGPHQLGVGGTDGSFARMRWNVDLDLVLGAGRTGGKTGSDSSRSSEAFVEKAEAYMEALFQFYSASVSAAAGTVAASTCAGNNKPSLADLLLPHDRVGNNARPSPDAKSCRSDADEADRRAWSKTKNALLIPALVSVLEIKLHCVSSPKLRSIAVDILGEFGQAELQNLVTLTTSAAASEDEDTASCAGATSTSLSVLQDHIFPTLHHLLLDSSTAVRVRAVHVLADLLSSATHAASTLSSSTEQQVAAANQYGKAFAAIGLTWREYLLPQLTRSLSTASASSAADGGGQGGGTSDVSILLAVAHCLPQFLAICNAPAYQDGELGQTSSASAAAAPTDRVDPTSSQQLQEESMQTLLRSLLSNQSGGSTQLKTHVLKALPLLAYGGTRCLPLLGPLGATQVGNLDYIECHRFFDITCTSSLTIWSDHIAVFFQKKGMHNFLLPHLISFMNEPDWFVRASFCVEAAKQTQIGQVSTEGLLWPCYEQCLCDAEERVTLAALQGVTTLVRKEQFSEQFRHSVLQRPLLPLTVHPAKRIREASRGLIQMLAKEDIVAYHTWCLPSLTPYLESATTVKLEFGSFADEEEYVLSLPTNDPNLLTWGAPVARPVFTALLEYFLAPGGPGAKAGRAGQVQDPAAAKQATATAVAFVKRACVDEAAKFSDAELERQVELIRPLIQTMPRNILQQTAYPYRDLAATATHSMNLIQKVAPHSTLSFPLCALDVKSARPLDVRMETAVYEQDGGLGTGEVGVSGATVGTVSRARSRNRDGSATASISTPVAIAHGRNGQVVMRDWKARALQLPKTSASLFYGASGVGLSPTGDGTMPQPHDNPAASGASAPAPHAGPLVLDEERPLRLLTTLYEYARGDLPTAVRKVDATRDGRLLLTGGADGKVLLWNTTSLDRDVCMTPIDGLALNYQLRCMKVLQSAGAQEPLAVFGGGSCQTSRTAASSLSSVKTTAGGTDTKSSLDTSKSNYLSLHSLENLNACISRVRIAAAGSSSVTASTSSSCSALPGGPIATAVDHCETSLDSVVLFATHTGQVSGWDIRMRDLAWSSHLPPQLGAVSCLATSSSYMVTGTMAGCAVLFDLRFLAPVRQWKVSTSCPFLDCKMVPRRPRDQSGSSVEIAAALGSEANEVAIFDLVRGETVKLFETQSSTGRPVSLPTLLPITDANVSRVTTAEQFSSFTNSGSLTAEQHLIFAGTDARTRAWNLGRNKVRVLVGADPLERFSTSVNKGLPTTVICEEVFLSSRGGGTSSRSAGAAAAGTTKDLSSSVEFDLRPGPREANPNHRDAILDMTVLNNSLLATAGRDGLVKLWC